MPTKKGSFEPVRDEINEVLLMQTQYTSENSEAMKRRGELVRLELADKLRRIAPELSRAGRIDDLRVTGSDGVGRKAEIPWTRIYSTSRSPHPTAGWYLVFLFSRKGYRAYLSLIQGATRWDGSEFKRRPEAELRSRSSWARDTLQHSGSLPSRWKSDILLGGRRGGLGDAYALGNVLAVAYDRDSVPEDATIRQDLIQAMDWLGTLYEKEEEGLYVPGDDAPELVDAENAIAAISGQGARSHQGRLLSAAERRAIERRAVDVTTAHLAGLGYGVDDVGDTESYDLHARRPDNELKVEVKGTTSTGTDILLTRNEVLLHRSAYPNNALAVVHSVHLDRSASQPRASGGVLIFEHPWKLDESRLSPIAYRYSRDSAPTDPPEFSVRIVQA
ncbi:MrcB family domain-containing protein [Cryobacterium zhongshanensis]|uniref:DUF3578 domain-containing protein n=1 Tax=Cryobacterium zhongshanensis TaxID=2928153 RepID=A0AA41QT17_9MICO|nr:DUF3578 domain-containing protein [Cryobacterium zhongshanensis]MCI4657131.1 DUF3578 domain-containing protein [Cryobacterium zhongshanensis]